MRKGIVIAAMMAVVLMLVPASQAVTFASLLSGGSITVGDKVFDDFTCSVFNAGTGFTGTGCNGTVVGIGAGTSEEGIRFGGVFIAAGDGNAGALMDITITYDVATTSGAAIIHDVNMSFDANVVHANASASVDETVCAGDISAICGSPVAHISVEASHLGANTVVHLSDHQDFSSLQSNVSVFKDIALLADSFGNVRFSILDQTFSQVTVPEPGTITLLGTALLGCVALLRRRQSKR